MTGEDVFFLGLFEFGFTFSWICDPRQVSAAESSCFSELSVRNSFSKKIENRLNILLLCCVVFFLLLVFAKVSRLCSGSKSFCGKEFFLSVVVVVVVVVVFFSLFSFAPGSSCFGCVVVVVFFSMCFSSL